MEPQANREKSLNHQVQECPQFTVTIARSREEMEPLRAAWKDLQRHPNSDMDYYLAVVDSRSKILRPHVVALYRHGRPVAMTIGRLEDIALDLKVGYKSLLRPRLRALTVIYGGFLGDCSDEAVDGMMAALMSSLRNGEADVLFIHNLDVDSPVYRRTSKTPYRTGRNYFPILNVHWEMSVPPDMAEFYESLEYKVRKNMRRSVRMLAKAYPDNIQIRCFRHKSEVETFLRDAEEVAKKTYQRGLGVGFVENEETSRLVRMAAENGYLRSYILYIGDRPVAFEQAVQYGDTLYCENAGYDPSYRKVDPGTNLFLSLLDDLCAEKKISRIDFGFGDADYKRSYGGHCREEASVYIFAPTIKGLAVNIMQSLLTAASKYAEAVFKKLSLYDRIKRSWRIRATVLKAKQCGKAETAEDMKIG